MTTSPAAIRCRNSRIAWAGFVAPRMSFSVEQSPKGCILSAVPYSVHRKNRGPGMCLTAQAVTGKETGLRSACEMLQSYLDAFGAHVSHDRFEDYARSVSLPLCIKTSSATLTVTSLDDLQEGFDDFCDMLRWRGVTRMVRTVIEARFEHPERLVGLYSTVLLGGGDQPVVPPYYTKLWLHCRDGNWQATRAHMNTHDPRWPLLLSHVPPVDSPPEELLL
jgi:hypothetical protein